jgi:hypothetical protein
MTKANTSWGTPRIHGKLLKLGIYIGERSVFRFMPPKARKPPSQTWRTFLDNHIGSFPSIDFFTVPTATFRVIYVFLVLSHDRRRVLHWNVTSDPGAHWTAEQIVEAFPEDTAPDYMMRDRDGIYGDYFRRRVESFAIEEVLSAPRSPWQNPYVERLVGSIRRDCLHHVIVLNERHLRRILTAYFVYYHKSPILGQGRAGSKSRPAAEHGRDRGATRSGWPASPLRAQRRLIPTSVRQADVDKDGHPSARTTKPRSPRRDHAPDIGALARDHARDRADPARIDIPSAPGYEVGEGQASRMGSCESFTTIATGRRHDTAARSSGRTCAVPSVPPTTSSHVAGAVLCKFGIGVGDHLCRKASTVHRMRQVQPVGGRAPPRRRRQDARAVDGIRYAGEGVAKRPQKLPTQGAGAQEHRQRI